MTTTPRPTTHSATDREVEPASVDVARLHSFALRLGVNVYRWNPDTERVELDTRSAEANSAR